MEFLKQKLNDIKNKNQLRTLNSISRTNQIEVIINKKKASNFWMLF